LRAGGSRSGPPASGSHEPETASLRLATQSLNTPPGRRPPPLPRPRNKPGRNRVLLNVMRSRCNIRLIAHETVEIIPRPEGPHSPARPIDLLRRKSLPAFDDVAEPKAASPSAHGHGSASRTRRSACNEPHRNGPAPPRRRKRRQDRRAAPGPVLYRAARRFLGCDRRRLSAKRRAATKVSCHGFGRRHAGVPAFGVALCHHSLSLTT